MATVTDTTEPEDEQRPPRRRLRIALVVAAVLAPIVGWLAFGYFGIQFLFIDDEVDEANPFATATSAPPAAAEPAAGGDAAGDADVTTLADGQFEGRAHPTSGSATVITDGTERRFLRFEDFATDNGPDLNVYLVADGDIDNGFVDLGNLKGNIGNQNYELDPEIDLDVHDTVVIWCVRFSVSFGEAALGVI